MSKKQDVPQGSMEQEAVDFLQTKCREVWWTTSRVPSTKQVSGRDKQEMTAAIGGSTAGFSVSKRVFASKHPAVQRVNTAFRAFDELRDRYTIVKAASASEEQGRFMVDPGRRIIRVADITAFEAEFAEAKQELESAVTLLASAVNDSVMVPGYEEPVESIKEMDRKRLGQSFDDKDYPSADDLQQSIRVTLPQYGVLTTDTLLPPAVLEREQARVQQELGDTIALAANRIGDELVEAMTSLVRSLSCRTYVDPLPGDAWRDKLVKIGKVEVAAVLTTKDDRSITSGKIKLRLTWKGEDNTTVEEISPEMTQEEYEKNLRPRETNERRQLRSNSIAKLQLMLDNLGQVRSMLGNEGEGIEKSLVQVKSLLANCARNGNPAEAVQSLKNSSAMAETLRSALSVAVDDVRKVGVAAVSSRRQLSI